jgi:ABC-type Fe3+/spermidine/putrescine transport system ATPase subunit
MADSRERVMSANNPSLPSGELRLVGIGHSYASASVLEDVTLTIPFGELWTLLGASGSGKTTLLRIIGGYIHPKKGKVILNGREITHVPPQDRGMGMVFQDYALFPHMTVFENIAYGLRVRRLSNAEIRKRVAGMLELNHLTGFEGKYPGELSGGQQQRVALARALVISPSVLLMDEAMGALDLRLRESMEIEVRKLQRELRITAIHVTHDQAEAMTMSDRIVVLKNGRVEQIGSPQDLNFRPASRYVAEFVGSNNIIPVEVRRVSSDGAWGVVRGSDREVLLCDAPPSGVTVPWQCFLIIRTEQMKASSTALSPGAKGIVVTTKYLGTSRCLVVETEHNDTLFALDLTEQFAIGERLYLGWAVDYARLIPADSAGAC